MDDSVVHTPSVQGELDKMFANAKLIYQPDPDIKGLQWPLLSLRNPFQGTLDLSACGDEINKKLVITTDVESFFERGEEKDKVILLIAPYDRIKQQINGTAKPFAKILDSWDGKVAPIGFFWRQANAVNLTRFNYLITEDPDSLASRNLYENWVKSQGKEWVPGPQTKGLKKNRKVLRSMCSAGVGAKSISCSFVNQN